MSKETKLSTLQRFFRLLSLDKSDIISVYIYALFNGVVALSLPLGIQAIINFISAGKVSTSWIVLVVFVILGVAFSGVMQIMQITITESIQQRIFTRSAFDFAFRIPRLKLEALTKEYMPELVNRFFDTLTVQKGLSKILLDFSGATLQVFFGLILLSLYHPFFIAFSLFLVILVYVIFRFTAPKGLKTSLVESNEKYKVVHWLEEMARAMKTFKLSGEIDYTVTKADSLVSKYLIARKRHFKTIMVQFINLVSFKVIIAASLLLIGGLLVINQQMNIGQFVASEIIIILILGSIEKLILSMETIYDVLTAIEKLGKVTDLPLETNGNVLREDQSFEDGVSIQLNALSYFNEDFNRYTLRDISLEIKQGEKICISGFDGAGKSFLMHTIAGLIDNYEGNLSYNHIPAKTWPKQQLHQQIGENLSGEELFRGSILENITLGIVGAQISEVKALIKLFQFEDFIQLLPNGLYTEVTPEGKNLPKSIRTKIMLCRALMGDKKLLLFEDDFNRLSHKIKSAFIDYLMSREATVLVVSNDVEIAKSFNRSLILKNGKLIADGNVMKLENESWFKEIF